MSDTNECFAQWLRAVRTASGLSQQKVADVLKAQGYTAFHQTTIAKIERGERPVRLDEGVAITSLFGTTLDAALHVEDVEASQGSIFQSLTQRNAALGQSLARRTSVLERIEALIEAELRTDPAEEAL